jgi:hypothetical protein
MSAGFPVPSADRLSVSHHQVAYRPANIYASSLRRRDKRWRSRHRRVFSVGSVSRGGALVATVCVTAAAAAERLFM